MDPRKNCPSCEPGAKHGHSGIVRLGPFRAASNVRKLTNMIRITQIYLTHWKYEGPQVLGGTAAPNTWYPALKHHTPSLRVVVFNLSLPLATILSCLNKYEGLMEGTLTQVQPGLRHG